MLWPVLSGFAQGEPSAAPAAGPFFVCTDYHCDTGAWVNLTDSQWQPVRALFAPNRSAHEERLAIRRAIALLEREVGGLAGTAHDLAGNAAGAGRPGQLDCISESRNTLTYLRLLFDDGLLRHHQIEGRRVRRPLIFNVHWSAVIRERSFGQAYAVDSWFLDNGQPPLIQPLEDWLAGKKPPATDGAP